MLPFTEKNLYLSMFSLLNFMVHTVNECVLHLPTKFNTGECNFILMYVLLIMC